jgi:uncharacterized membrane protein
MSSGAPSTFHAKPNPDKGEHVSTFPIGITGLASEPYAYYEGIGGEGEMTWPALIGIIVGVIVLIGFIIWLYLWYSKVSQASNIAGGLLNAARR